MVTPGANFIVLQIMQTDTCVTVSNWGTVQLLCRLIYTDCRKYPVSNICKGTLVFMGGGGGGWGGRVFFPIEIRPFQFFSENPGLCKRQAEL